MSGASGGDRDVRLEPNRFYWGELETTNVGGSGTRGRHRTNQLGFLLESVLPVPIESVHAVFLPLAEGRVLGCAMDREQLARRSASAISLGPSAIPEFAGIGNSAGQVDSTANSINLLVREFEPASVRRARSQWRAQAAVLLALCAFLIAIGLERRTRAAHADARASLAAVEDVYEQNLGPSESWNQPPAALLLSELRRLRQATAARAEVEEPQDASSALADVLARWPEELEMRTDSIQARHDRITLAARLPDSASAERLERALGDIVGWRTGQRMLRRSRDNIELTLPLTRETEPSW